MDMQALTPCTECQRGREACEYCECVSDLDWESMCDCGLCDFGAHLVDCQERSVYKYVIAADYATAELRR